MDPTKIDWCARVTAKNWGSYGKQRVLGECAHIHFEKKYNGSKVKYTRAGVSVVPDGASSGGKVLLELKPNGAAARAAAKKTASVTGIKTLAYRWVYNSTTNKFDFINTTNEGQGVKNQGRNAKSVWKSGWKRGYGVPMARGGTAAGYRVKIVDGEDPDAPVVFTEAEEQLLADWVEYTEEEYEALFEGDFGPPSIMAPHAAETITCDAEGDCIDSTGSPFAPTAFYLMDAELNEAIEVALGDG